MRLQITYGSMAAVAVLFTTLTTTAWAQDLPSIQNLKRDDAIYASIPDKFKAAGVINAGTEADYPPFEFLDEQSRLVGADIDISTALGKILGVPIKNNQTEFSAVIPGLASGRLDMAISSMGDYTSREVTMNFVDYYHGGMSLLMKAGAPVPKDALDVCGTALGAMKSTSSEKFAMTNNDKCVAAGKPAIQVKAFPKQNDAVLAVTSGRVNAVVGDAATNGYSATQIGPSLQNVVVDFYGGGWVAGMAVPKNSGLFQPLYDATVVLVKTGVYMDILKKWGLEGGAVQEVGKNQGTVQGG